MEKKPHVVFVASPGMGHVIPMAELAKRLIQTFDFTATIVTFTTMSSQTLQAFLSSLPSSISSVSLPPVDLSDLPPNTAIETLLSEEVARSIPNLLEIFNGLKSRSWLIAVLADLFCADVFDAAKEAGVPGYLFFPTNLMTLTLLLHLPEIDSKLDCEFGELKEPVRLPGCVPIPGTEIASPLLDRKNECYKWMVRHGKKYREAKGILVNSFEGFEPEVTKILRQPEPDRPPVFTIGPLIRSGEKPDESGCIDWLDKQPTKSVLFVSFGSAGTLTKEQMDEIAFGLESSGQRFLWMIRSPSNISVTEHFFDSKSKSDPFFFLPEGFVERNKEKGMVVPSWVPQINVLSHQSTGGFVSHCGWNSTLETIMNGVPIIAWPLFAEQKQNAVMLEKGVGVALRLKARDDGVVDQEEIAKVVRELMQGEEGDNARKKAVNLKEKAEIVLKEGGETSKVIEEVVAIWKNEG